MNSKTLRYSPIVNQHSSIFTAIKQTISALMQRQAMAQARARYRSRRQQEARKDLHRNILSDLPVEQKLKLGMYHFID